MPMPTFVGVGTAASGTGNITPAFPGGYTAVADDIDLIFTEVESEDTPAPTNYSQLNGINIVQASGTITRLKIFWRRLAAGNTAPLITEAAGGNHLIGAHMIVRGVRTGANPWNITAGSAATAANTAVSITGVTTTAPDCYVISVFTNGVDSLTGQQTGAWTNASLANVTGRFNAWTDQGLGGGFAVATGEKAAAGAINATTTAQLTSQFYTRAMIALQGVTAPAGRPPRRRQVTGQPRVPRRAVYPR